MIPHIIASVIKQFPAVLPHLTGRARFIAFAFKGGEGSGNFGHAGRPGEVGGSAPSGGGAISPEGRAAFVQDLANKNNITSKIVYAKNPEVSDYRNKNEVPDNACAVCDQAKGVIYIFDAAFESGESIEGIIAHEEMHNIVYNSKYGQKEKADFINKNETYTQDDFIKAAGITDYAKYKWVAWAMDDVSFMHAVNETLCEIERVKTDNPNATIPPMWEELYNKVKEGV